MNLTELSGEYRAGGLACRARADALRAELQSREHVSAQERRNLKLRITHLEDMATATLSTARFLAHYYDHTKS